VTLQTYEEQEILRTVRQLLRKVEVLECLVEEILEEVRPPQYKPTTRITVTPVHHGHHHGR
jgi:hypothetical protein